MGTRDRNDGLLLVTGAAAVCAVLFCLMGRRKSHQLLKTPPPPNPDPTRNSNPRVHAVFFEEEVNAWVIAPKLSNLYNLGVLQTLVFKIVGSPHATFPANAFALNTADPYEQFSTTVLAPDRRGRPDRILLINNANTVEWSYDYTLLVQMPGQPPATVDPTIHSGPTV